MRLRLQDQYGCRLERSPSPRHGLCAMRSSVITRCRIVPVRRYGGGFCEFKRERKMLFQPSREGMLFSSRGAPLHRALHRYLQCGFGDGAAEVEAERIGRRANADNRARYHGGQDGRRRRVAAGGAPPRVVSCLTFRTFLIAL
jgi:hypothetical protein